MATVQSNTTTKKRNRLQKNSGKSSGDSYTELSVISQGNNNPKESGSATESVVQVQNNQQRPTRRQRRQLEQQEEDSRSCTGSFFPL